MTSGSGPRFGLLEATQPGEDAQVDWYEAVAILGEEEVTLQVFCVRSMASGAAFHRAYPRATQQAFLEAHEGAFEYFGGVFATLRYDFVPGNKIAVLCPSAFCARRRFVPAGEPSLFSRRTTGNSGHITRCGCGR
jgi:transposase